MDLARIRWDNVAKLTAVLAVVAVIVAWPRLEAPPPVVPDGAVRALPAVAPPARPSAPPPGPPRAGRKASLTGTQHRPRPGRRRQPPRAGRASSPSGTQDGPRAAAGTRRAGERLGRPTEARPRPAPAPQPPSTRQPPPPAPAPTPAPPASTPTYAPTPAPPSEAAVAAAEFGVD